MPPAGSCGTHPKKTWPVRESFPEETANLGTVPLTPLPSSGLSPDPEPRVEPSELAQLREENARLTALVTELQEKLAAALAENERLRKSGSGGAAPFSRGKRKQNPKKAGRKPGQGLFTRRQAPDYAGCDVTEETAALDTPHCPDCGGRLGAVDYEEASTIDVPEVPRPRVKRFRVEVRRCTCCRRLHRGRHPDLPPDQHGATAHRVGEGAYALARWLHHGQGVPVRRLPALLRQMLALPLTQSAITQHGLRQVGETRPVRAPAPADAGPTTAAPRAAEQAPTPTDELPATGPIGRIYLSLRQAIAREPVVHTDDTSWRIGGQAAWLMVFSSVRLVVYQIRDQHRNEEVREILAEFAGCMVCDRGSSYESRHLVRRRQQKCLSHLIRNIVAVLDYLPDESRKQAETLLALLREALALWHAFHAGAAGDYGAERERLVEQLDRVLAPVTHLNPYLNRLLNGIGRQHDRGNVLRFLEDPQIEPTNNRAERDLRGPVIARKVSQCSRTGPGAEAFAAWSSVVTTLVRSGAEDPVRALTECLRTGGLPGLELPAPRPLGRPASC